MKNIGKKVGLSIVVLVLIFGSGLFWLMQGLGEPIAVEAVEASQVSDGYFDGSFDKGRWSNQIHVEVKDGKIKSIEIEEDVTFSKEEVSTEIFDRVIAQQSTDVDTVTEATVTSKAYLKSIEDALKKGMK
ncbi:MAG TPA: FMN-binding protein [Eubacteriaceae bacterium]|nr:FMN-binding protein [Eubacteriaceae bacterium]